MPDNLPVEKIRVSCSDCKKTIKAPPKFAGKKVKCPGCGAPLTVPVPKSEGNASPSVDAEIVKPTLTKRGDAEAVTTASSTGDSQEKIKDPGNLKSRFNLIASAIFLVGFCVAVFSFAPTIQADIDRWYNVPPVDRSTAFLLHTCIGIGFAMIAWASIWFVFHPASFAKRVLGLISIIICFAVSAIAGFELSGGAGPVSIDESRIYLCGLPSVFLAFSLPLFGVCFFKQRLNWGQTSANESSVGGKILAGLLPFIIGAALYGVYVAGSLPWAVFFPVIAIASVLVALVAVMIAWKVKRTWLSIILAACHLLLALAILYGLLSMRFIRLRPPMTVELCVQLGAFMLSIYVPLMVARFCGFRLVNSQTAELLPSTPLTKLDGAMFGFASLVPVMLLVYAFAPETFQSPPPPKAIVTVLTAHRTYESRLGLVLAREQGEAYVLCFKEPAGSEYLNGDLLQGGDAAIQTAKGFAPARQIASFPEAKLYAVAANQVSDPIRFRKLSQCKPGDVLGVARFEIPKGKPRRIHREDLLVTKVSKTVGAIKVNAEQLTGKRYLRGRGIVYNQAGEVVGLARYTPVSQTRENGIASDQLDQLISACQEHLPHSAKE